MSHSEINGHSIAIDPNILLRIAEFLIDPEAQELDTQQLVATKHDFLGDDAVTRYMLLAEHLGMPPGHEHYSAQYFAQIVEQYKKPSRIPRHILQSAIAKIKTPIESASPYTQYREKLKGLLTLSRSSFIIGEGSSAAIPDFANDHNPSPYLDITVFTHRWPKELTESPAWNCIESPIAGIPDQPIDSTWVNLTLREIHSGGRFGMALKQEQAWQDLYFDHDGAGISAQELLLSTKRLTIVTGLPGGGKSTLIKWLARYVISEPNAPFGIPAVISLRHYAREKQSEPNLTLFQHFLRHRGVNDPVQAQRWQALYDGLQNSDKADAYDAILWLLDGWDEVPLKAKDLIIPEIRAISLFPCILTTRHSGNPLQLPADRYYEIMGLKHGAALDLAHSWLASVGCESHFSAIEIGLEESPELRKLARSPFLLTLMCALATNPNTKGEAYGWLPRRFGDVLSQALKLIYAQHNNDPKQNQQFDSERQREVARFAWWLFAETDNGPQFVFDEEDYERAGHNTETFSELLVPSRLIAKPNVDARYFQFHHASFQEYLSAVTLEAEPCLISNWTDIFLDANWAEVSRYVTEIASTDSPVMDYLWGAARAVLENRDRYGLILARVANLLFAAGYQDGGFEVLGIDIRDDLWLSLKRYEVELPAQLMKSFIDMDATGFAKRILDDRIKGGSNTYSTSWLSFVSIFDLEPLYEEEKYQAVLTLPEVANFCPELPGHIFEAGNEEEYLTENAILFNQAIEHRDIQSAYQHFLDLLNDGEIEHCIEALPCFHTINDHDAGPIFYQIATAEDVPELIRGIAVAELMAVGNSTLCSKVIVYAATLSSNDPKLLPIIGNLVGYGLNSREIQLLISLSRTGDFETQCAAIDVLSGTRSRNVALELLNAFSVQTDLSVRRSILSCLENLAEPALLTRLWAIKLDGSLFEDEWDYWLCSVLSAITKGGTVNQGLREVQKVIRWIKDLITKLENEIANENEKHAFSAVLHYPQILGNDSSERLLKIASKTESDELIAKIILAVGSLGKKEDIVKLTNFLNESPANSKNVCNAIYEAIGEISPMDLISISTPEADSCRAKLAYRQNILYIDALKLPVSSQSKAVQYESLERKGADLVGTNEIFMAMVHLTLFFYHCGFSEITSKKTKENDSLDPKRALADCGGYCISRNLLNDWWQAGLKNAPNSVSKEKLHNYINEYLLRNKDFSIAIKLLADLNTVKNTEPLIVKAARSVKKDTDKSVKELEIRFGNMRLTWRSQRKVSSRLREVIKTKDATPFEYIISRVLI